MGAHGRAASPCGGAVPVLPAGWWPLCGVDVSQPPARCRRSGPGLTAGSASCHRAAPGGPLFHAGGVLAQAGGHRPQGTVPRTAPPIPPGAHPGHHPDHVPHQVIGPLTRVCHRTRLPAAARADSQLLHAKRASRSRCSTTIMVTDGSDKSSKASAGSRSSRPRTRPHSPGNRCPWPTRSPPPPAGPDRPADRARTPAHTRPPGRTRQPALRRPRPRPRPAAARAPASGPGGTTGTPSADEPHPPAHSASFTHSRQHTFAHG